MFLFFTLSSSTLNCPPGTNYIYEQTKNGTIKPNEWHYFMTSNTKTSEKPLFFTLECDNDLEVYQAKSADCPDENDILILDAKKGQKNKIQLQVYNEYGFINVGLKNGPNPTNFTYSLSSQTKAKMVLTPVKKLILLFAVMIGCVVAFFIYVTNPVPEHEKND